MSNILDHQGVKSVKVTSQRLEKIENLGIEKKNLASAFDNLLKCAESVQELMPLLEKEINAEIKEHQKEIKRLEERKKQLGLTNKPDIEFKDHV